MDAYVYIRIASGSMANVLAVLAAKPGIKRVVPTVGEWDLLLYARGATLDEIGNNVLAEVHQIPGVVQTITAPVVPPDRAGLFGIAVAPPQILPNACYVHIKAAAGTAVDIGEALAGMEEVDGVALLAGRWDILACIAQPWETASGIILEQLHAIPGVLSTSTLVSIAFSSAPGAERSSRRAAHRVDSRTPAGNENRTPSSTIGTDSTSSKPCSASHDSIRVTRCSGALAPEVTPTVSASATHAGSTSVSSSTRYAAAPSSRATSASRFEFEEFFEPITSTTSARGAIAFTAS